MRDLRMKMHRLVNVTPVKLRMNKETDKDEIFQMFSLQMGQRWPDQKTTNTDVICHSVVTSHCKIVFYCLDTESTCGERYQET